MITSLIPRNLVVLRSTTTTKNYFFIFAHTHIRFLLKGVQTGLLKVSSQKKGRKIGWGSKWKPFRQILSKLENLVDNNRRGVGRRSIEPNKKDSAINTMTINAQQKCDEGSRR